MQKDKEVSKLFEDCYVEDDWIYANGGQFIVYQWAETRWNSRTRKRYLSLGYIEKDTKMIVDVRHLSYYSEVKTIRECPTCGREDVYTWYTVIKGGTTFCKECSNKSRRRSRDDINDMLSLLPDNRLIVIDDKMYKGKIGDNYRKCLCTCGNTTIVHISALTSNNTKSCGCLWYEKLSRTGKDNPHWKGGSKSIYYGQSWRSQCKLARVRDGNICQRCGKNKKENGRNMDVHHIIKFKDFGYIQGENTYEIQANDLDNLVCLCMSCHKIVEKDLVKIDDFRNEKGEIENG